MRTGLHLLATMMFTSACLTLWAAQAPAPVPIPSLPFPPTPTIGAPPTPIICTGEETPCDPDRPWMRGTVEKFCGHPAQLAKLRQEHPGVETAHIQACACKHKCDPNDKHADMTDSRSWDGSCGARCNPKNCVCPHPCDS